MIPADFWIGMGERAAKTFAQALLASFTVGFTVTTIYWPTALGLAVTAAVLSVLTSLASLPIGGVPAPMLRAVRPGKHGQPVQEQPVHEQPVPPYPYPEDPDGSRPQQVH